MYVCMHACMYVCMGGDAGPYRLLRDELSEGLLQRAELPANALLQLLAHAPKLSPQISLTLCPGTYIHDRPGSGQQSQCGLPSSLSNSFCRSTLCCLSRAASMSRMRSRARFSRHNTSASFLRDSTVNSAVREGVSGRTS